MGRVTLADRLIAALYLLGCAVLLLLILAFWLVVLGAGMMLFAAVAFIPWWLMFG